LLVFSENENTSLLQMVKSKR